MELRKKIKKDALVSLRNSWGKAIAILLFICGVYLLFLLLEQLFGSLLHIDFFERRRKAGSLPGHFGSGDALCADGGAFCAHQLYRDSTPPLWINEMVSAAGGRRLAGPFHHF